jgi:superfamily II DNA or RNA helicase
MLELRDYQAKAVTAGLDGLARDVRHPAEVMPTGTGKTVIFAHLGKQYRETVAPDGQIVVMGHREELLGQAASKFRAVAPELSVGIVQAQRNECAADVVCASVQTLAGGRRLEMIPRPRLLIVDECHHAMAPTWRRVIDRMVERGAQVIGYTATMSRGDDRVLGEVWQEIVAHEPIAAMIARGYLARPVGIRVKVADLDLDQVKRSHGDFADKAMGDALEASLAPEAIAKAIMEQCPNRQGIIFAPTVSSATVIAAAVRDAGMTVAIIDGTTPKDARAAALADFKAGRIQWLANCMVLTEGTDLPMAEVCVIARPTSSIALYVQMVGRVLRPHPGKRGAMLLDVVGATTKHRLASPIDLFGDSREEMALAGVTPEDLGLEPEEMETEGRGHQPVEPGMDGPLVFKRVDLFDSSDLDWQRTDQGVWFIAAGDRYIAVQPGPVPGEWELLDMHRSIPGTGRWIERGIPDQGYAMAWAQAQVTMSESAQARLERSFRGQALTRVPRVQRQALGMGIPIDDQMSVGDAMVAIEQRLASRRIDPGIPFYARGRLT